MPEETDEWHGRMIIQSFRRREGGAAIISKYRGDAEHSTKRETAALQRGKKG